MLCCRCRRGHPGHSDFWLVWIEAVRILFAGAAEDTQTMISEDRGGQVRSRIHKLDEGAGSDNE